MKVICPVCRQVMEGQSLKEWPEFPFCSRRCKLLDLGRWLDEAYSIPAQEDDSPRPQDRDAP